MKKLFVLLSALCVFSAHAQVIDMNQTQAYSPYIFGHNLEHTRSAINGGLSAQMLKNRKFAGKPAPNQGISSKWFPIGERVLFLQDASPYTKHICLPNMKRTNERRSQIIQNLIEGQTAGMGQQGLSLVQGKPYELRIVAKVSAPLKLKVELTDRDGTKVYATHLLSFLPSEDWLIKEFDMTPSGNDTNAAIRYTFTEQTEICLGALSMMPKDHFHGMRSDVVAHLKEIGPTLIRWPGGNFAGEYRWKDGLLPSDQRAPLQAYTEIETQPHSDGFDYHEINTDDFIALCREVGAAPLLTINLAWNSPEESAQWVEYCNGSADTEYGKIRAERGYPEPYNVHFWSLGNEMGYGHMEGPNGSIGYTEYALRHADAMLEITPDLELFASGPYPNDEWEIFEGKLRQLPMTNESSRTFKRFFQAGATDCEVDNQGRILLTATLREFAGITKDVTVVGVGERAEIWSKEKWEEKNNIDDMEYLKGLNFSIKNNVNAKANHGYRNAGSKVWINKYTPQPHHRDTTVHTHKTLHNLYRFTPEISGLIIENIGKIHINRNSCCYTPNGTQNIADNLELMNQSVAFTGSRHGVYGKELYK